LATASSGIIFLFVTIFALRFGRQVREFKIAPFWPCILFLSYHSAGENGLGLVLAISIIAANIHRFGLLIKNLISRLIPWDMADIHVRWIRMGHLSIPTARFFNNDIRIFSAVYKLDDCCIKIIEK
jgi:hypothetical protein